MAAPSNPAGVADSAMLDALVLINEWLEKKSDNDGLQCDEELAQSIVRKALERVAVLYGIEVTWKQPTPA